MNIQDKIKEDGERLATLKRDLSCEQQNVSRLRRELAEARAWIATHLNPAIALEKENAVVCKQLDRLREALERLRVHMHNGKRPNEPWIRETLDKALAGGEGV